MSKKRAFISIVTVVTAAVAVLALASEPASAAEAKARMSIGSMFYTATFSDIIGFFDMFAIYLCSLASVALIIEHCISIRRIQLVPDISVAQIKTMFDEHRFREALEFCQADPSFISGVVHAGLIEAANGYEAMENAMQDAASERASRLFRKIEWLNLIGNIAPMFGLWGTIWGMMVAFGQIEAKGGKANPADLAGGIMIALVSTFTGLVVAIPALSGYSIFKTRVEQLAQEAALVAEELLANFKPGASAEA